jgi:NADH-quinone oxidoreductase subunit H
MSLDFSFWITILWIACAIAVIPGVCGYLTLLERKIAAWVQDRPGPNRVGPLGLFQPIADGAKFLFKEQVIPGHVDKVFYLLAPGISLATALLAFAVVPFGSTTPAPVLRDYRARLENPDAPAPAVWPQTNAEREAVLAADRAYARQVGGKTFEEQVAEYNDTTQFVITPHADIGIVWVFAIGSLAVYAVILGGWSSNNKYSLLGSLRSSAQLLSYEIPMGLSVLGVMVVTGSLNLERMIDYQYQHGWNILFQPLACLMFVTAIFAECNRLPFDLPECEQELVAGYHTEYSGMKFGLFMLGEYTHMITTSFLVAIVFFGGWLLPGVTEPGSDRIIVKLIILGGKMFLGILFFMWVRWTIPRFRFDQLMGLTWKVLMPLALASLVLVLVVRQYLTPNPIGDWVMLPVSLLILVGSAWGSVYLPRPPARANVVYVRGAVGDGVPSR